MTELLIRHGANVGALDLWQFSPLHEAASKGRTEVCSLLLSHGADPTTVNCHGKSAIDVAATQELKDALSLEFRGNREHNVEQESLKILWLSFKLLS